MRRDIPLHTLAGVPDAEVSIHPFTTQDGLGLSLVRFRRGDTGGSGDAVLLHHGLTASCDSFIMPEHHNLVSFLLDSGFGEVWALDSRMSNRHGYNLAMHRFTLDDVALFDHPAAVAVIREHSPDRRLHVIAQCLGSVSFMMALAAGLVTGISSVVANSVALTPRVPAWSLAKLAVAPAVLEYGLGLPYLSPNWADEPAFTRGWAISKLNSLVHRECDVPACHMLSLMWGTGWPAMYEHENLLPVTHARIGDLCQASGVQYDRHVRRMVLAGRAVRYDRKHGSLPNDYLAAAADITTPVLFTSGDRNRIFGNSNKICHKRMSADAPGRHEFLALPGYGHFDPFIGKHAAVEVFPQMVDFIKRRAV